MTPVPLKSGAHGRFLLKNVAAEGYHLTVSRNGYVDLKYGQKTASDPGAMFHLHNLVRTGQTFSSGWDTLESSAETFGGAMQPNGGRVVALPESEERKFLLLFRARSTDQYGHFEIRGLAPGKYKVLSWKGIEAHTWEDPDFLKDYEDKDEEIEVRDGNQKSVKLELLSAKDSE